MTKSQIDLVMGRFRRVGDDGLTNVIESRVNSRAAEICKISNGQQLSCCVIHGIGDLEVSKMKFLAWAYEIGSRMLSSNPRW